MCHPAEAAFENLVLQSYLHPTAYKGTDQPFVYFGSLNFPSFTYLNQYEIGVHFLFKKTRLDGYLYTSGDRLYRESMARFGAGTSIVSRLSYHIKISAYHVRIAGYGSASTWSAGLSSQLSLNDDLKLTVDYDNLLFGGSAQIYKDIPCRGIVMIESKTFNNQVFIYRLEKEIPYPVNHHFYWRSTLRPSLSILGGFTSDPQTLLVSLQIKKHNIRCSIGMIYHPVLMTSVGLRLTYRL